MNQYTRVTLLQKLKDRGNEHCWKEFYDLYKPYIFVILRESGVTNKDIDDLTQTILLTCWDKIIDFDYDPEKGRFRSWLRRIIRNKLGNYFAKNSRRSRLLEQYSEELVLEPEIEDRVEEEWKDHLSQIAWQRIDGSFSPRVKQAFILSMQGRPLAEIAGQLEVEENTVQVYKLRITKALSREIKNLRDELE